MLVRRERLNQAAKVARRGAGAVERGGLENRWACKRPVGSNPTPAATRPLPRSVHYGERSGGRARWSRRRRHPRARRRTAADGAPARRDGDRAREGARRRAAPDRPQQRRRARGPLLHARLAQGDALPARRRPAPGVLRGARPPLRGVRQARRRASTSPSSRGCASSSAAAPRTACPACGWVDGRRAPRARAVRRRPSRACTRRRRRSSTSARSRGRFADDVRAGGRRDPLSAAVTAIRIDGGRAGVDGGRRRRSSSTASSSAPGSSPTASRGSPATTRAGDRAVPRRVLPPRAGAREPRPRAALPGARSRATRSSACTSRGGSTAPSTSAPNAVLAFAREGYRRRDVRAARPRRDAPLAGLPARSRGSTGGPASVEMRGSLSKRAFAAEARRYVPEVTAATSCRRRPASGRRRSTRTARSSTTSGSPRSAPSSRVRNAPSPGGDVVARDRRAHRRRRPRRLSADDHPLGMTTRGAERRTIEPRCPLTTTR